MRITNTHVFFGTPQDYMSPLFPRRFSITHPVDNGPEVISLQSAFLHRQMTSSLMGTVNQRKKAMRQFHNLLVKGADVDGFEDASRIATLGEQEAWEFLSAMGRATEFDGDAWARLHLKMRGLVNKQVLDSSSTFNKSVAHNWWQILLSYYCTDEGRDFFKRLIKDTEGKMLVYAATDTFQGIGLHETDPSIHSETPWPGRNFYGKALQRFRDTLIQNPGAYATDPKEQSRFK